MYSNHIKTSRLWLCLRKTTLLHCFSSYVVSFGKHTLKQDLALQKVVSLPDEWSWHSCLILLHGVTCAAVVLLYSCYAFVEIREKNNAFNIKTPSICPKFIICIFLINIYMLHGKLCYIGSFIIYLFEWHFTILPHFWTHTLGHFLFSNYYFVVTSWDIQYHLV